MCVHFLRPLSIADCRAAACENVLIMKVFCPDSEGEEAGDRGDRAHTEPLRIGLYHVFPALSYAYHYKDANPVRTRRFGTWHDSDPWRIFSTSSRGLWAFPRALTYIYGIPTSFLVEPACATVTSLQSEV